MAGARSGPVLQEQAKNTSAAHDRAGESDALDLPGKLYFQFTNGSTGKLRPGVLSPERLPGTVRIVMKPPRKSLPLVITGLLLLYVGSAAALFFVMPGPHQQFECMVIGTGSAGITIFALFAGYIARTRF